MFVSERRLFASRVLTWRVMFRKTHASIRQTLDSACNRESESPEILVPFSGLAGPTAIPFNLSRGFDRRNSVMWYDCTLPQEHGILAVHTDPESRPA